MSELGPLSFGKQDEQIFLGREIAQHRDYSEATAIRIDDQVRRLIEEGYGRARRIIEERSDALVRVAEALLEREVLDGSEVIDLINGKELKAFIPKPPSGNAAQPVIAPTPQPTNPGTVPGLLGGGSPQPA
jgi:cell division protease FtsH